MKREDAEVYAIVLVGIGFLTGIALLYFKSSRGPPSMMTRTMRRHPSAFKAKSVHWGKTTIHTLAGHH
ncbi:hypothetical protein TWF718_003166 [Orbilia javanica]|uniref:Uncharacterized protein n=1 Tax=Orbilia javanica TaxID=47235 RepID=A0AAN8MJF9_9PEZI